MTLAVKDLLGDYRPATPEEILVAAQRVIAQRYRRGVSITAPQASFDLFHQRLALREQEVFAALFLDNRHRVIVYEELFYGTIDGASVHPRVVVTRALMNQAAALIVAHNHPSGDPEPSPADRTLTYKLRQALELIDVRLLDHIVVGETCVSLREQGVF